MANTLKNLVAMAGSTTIRLVFATAAIVILARTLGPSEFGQLMVLISASTLLALFANFGQTPYLLREVSRSPERGKAIMEDVLSSKLILGSFAVLVSLFALGITSVGNYLLFILFLVALLLESITEFLNVGYRATNRFFKETQIAVVTATLQFTMIVAAILIDTSVLSVGFAYLISRLLTLLITWKSQSTYFAAMKPSSVSRGIQEIRKTRAYAADFGMQSLFGQVDSIVLGYTIGSSAVGIYQSGMRIFLAGAQAAGVVSSVFIPKGAAALGESIPFQIAMNKLGIVFVTIGAIGFAVFALAPASSAAWIFGKEFQDLSLLMNSFGVLFLIRFSAGGIGLILTIQGNQSYRAFCTFLHWIVVGLCFYLLGVSNPTDWIRYLVTGNLLLAIFYIGVAVIHGKFRPNIYCAAALMLVGGITLSWLL